MNTRLTFLTIVLLALPQALLAQATNESPTPPAASSGRQAIISKLEHIRLDDVKYDGLPLGEVVLNLRDQAKKRDPEKKGINFLINQNLDSGKAMTTTAQMPVVGPDGKPLPVATEQLDVSSILVVIKPPLNDVRLLDVLDAVVKVAQQPIKYSIEDYGVVFSPRGPGLVRAENQTRPAAAASGGRQLISDKLARIRFDNVKYDGLPLGEVVLMIRDEAKKRDPEGKGVNFLLNQNLDPGEAIPTPVPELGPDGNPLPTAPTEREDVSGVVIVIKPPLNDVRLVDVLDVVVKVAQQPIKYSIEDYGVVFSPRGSEPAQKGESGFAFPGGTPREFLNAVQQQYRVDWLSMADIPKEMAYVHIPRLRIGNDPSGLAMPPTREGELSDWLRALLSLYNQLGQQKPELGSLLVKGNLTNPAVVMFVPDKAVADTQLKIKVKAFSMSGISDAERTKLQEDIDQAKKEAMEYASLLRGSSGPRNLGGTVAMHNETGLLVATGTESFVEMVESIVTAWQAKERARNPDGPSKPLPNTPGK